MKKAVLLGKNPFRWFVSTWRAKGLARVLTVAWHSVRDMFWDFRHGTETLSRIPPEELQTDSQNKCWATYYGATKARPLLDLLGLLELSLDRVFVDFGSGKGRVLLVAAQYGFKRIVGIDFSRHLCEVARRNIEAFQCRYRLSSEITVVHSDVVHFDIQDDHSVFFLYDPFSTEVLVSVLANLRRSMVDKPRPVCLIYNAPRHHGLMQDSGLFSRSQRYELGGNEFHVYWASDRLD